MPDFPPIVVTALKEEDKGTLTADGTIQTVVDKTSTKPFMCQLILDVSNMSGADQVEIVEEMKVLATGSLQKFTKTRITGKQDEPVLIFAPKYAVREYKVTLQQLAGTYRSFDWSLVVME